MFQLEFVDMDLEESDRCSYDSLTVLGDVEQTEEIGRMSELDVTTNLSCLLLSFSLSHFLSLFLIFVALSSDSIRM